MIQVWSVPQGPRVAGLIPSLVLLGSGVTLRGGAYLEVFRSLWMCCRRGHWDLNPAPLPLPCHEMNSLMLIFHRAAIGPETAGAVDRNLHTVSQVASPLYKLMISGI